MTAVLQAAKAKQNFEYGIVLYKPEESKPETRVSNLQDVIDAFVVCYCEKIGVSLYSHGNKHCYTTVSKDQYQAGDKSNHQAVETFSKNFFDLERIEVLLDSKKKNTVGVKIDSEKRIEGEMTVIDAEKLLPSLRMARLKDFKNKLYDYIFDGKFKKTGALDEEFLTEDRKKACIRSKDLFEYKAINATQFFEKSAVKNWKKEPKEIDASIVAKLDKIFKCCLNKGEISFDPSDEKKGWCSPERLKAFLLSRKDDKKGLKSAALDDDNVGLGEIMIVAALNGAKLDFRRKASKTRQIEFLRDPRIKGDTNWPEISHYTGLSQSCHIYGLKFGE